MKIDNNKLLIIAFVLCYALALIYTIKADKAEAMVIGKDMKVNNLMVGLSARTATKSDKFDYEGRFGIDNKNYILYERENGNGYTGHGVLFEYLKTLELEMFKRQSNDIDLETFRLFENTKYKEFDIRYGVSLLGDHYKFSAALYSRLVYYDQSLSVETDLQDNYLVTLTLKKIYNITKRLSIEPRLEYRMSKKDYFWFKTLLNYKLL